MHSSTVDRLQVVVAPTRAAMGAAAGAAAVAALQDALARQGNARAILASAPSQNEVIETLSQAALDWSRITLFHMDEYAGLPATHPASFRAYQQSHLLSTIHPAAFHGIRGEAEDSAAECARYSALLAEAPIDLVCLGVGENGHLAFNDPPVANFEDPALVKVVELDEVCRQQQVNDGCFPSLEAVPRHALTLTIPALLSGRTLVCTVPGPRKAAAVRATLRGPVETACPASILRRHANATLFVDEAAAAEAELAS